jgi:hypothetical protein
MLLTHEEMSLFVSSSQDAGARHHDTFLGSFFEVQLDDPIRIPADAVNVTCELAEATVWWTMPNIITYEYRTGVQYPNKPDNNNFHISYGTGGSLQAWHLRIPQGLYDITQFNAIVHKLLDEEGAPTFTDSQNRDRYLVDFIGDGPTQKVILSFNAPNVSIDMTQDNTPNVLLGLEKEVYSSPLGSYTPDNPYQIVAPNTADFNHVDSLFVHSNLVQQGIRFNNRYNQSIAKVLIDVKPGSLIVYRPFNPAKSTAQHLAGSSISILEFWLTDQNGQFVDTLGNDWGARVTIRYDRPYATIGK